MQIDTTASDSRPDLVYSEFRRDRSKKNSKRCSSTQKEETQKRKRRSHQVGLRRLRYRVTINSINDEPDLAVEY